MDEKQVILNSYLKKVICLMKDNNLVLPEKAVINIYHHKGVNNLAEIGAMFMNIVNKEYCKSYVVLLKGQKYPEHFHRIKEESFYVLCGKLKVNVENEVFDLKPGQIFHIECGQNHSFWADDDVIFEELSTQYVPNDSVYTDDLIRNATYDQRRTTINQEKWKEIRKQWIR